MWSILGYIAGAIGLLKPGSGLWRAWQQQTDRILPNQLLGINEAVTARIRGLITEDEYNSELVRQGIDPLRAVWYIQLAEQLVPVGELLELRVRDKIDDEEFLLRGEKIGFKPDVLRKLLGLKEQYFDPNLIITAWRRKLFEADAANDWFNDLKKQGWTPDRIEALKKVSEVYPSTSDLIRFAVREVYTPAIAEKFGQYEDYPEKFTGEAAKLGISEEHAKQYWAAHWDLPSAGQGFEMFHRAIISEEELKMLLRALDVMPFWRDRLIKVAYNPLTRVDVRRMHLLGILDEAGVKKAYLDAGYSPENAERMTKFTIQYNEQHPLDTQTAEEEDRSEYKGLTASNILHAYKEAIISESAALEYLKAIGVKETVGTLLLSMAKYDEAKAEQSFLITNLKETYLAGGIEFNALSDELDKLNLPASQKEKVMRESMNALIKKDQRLTLAQLTEMLAYNIVSTSEFVEGLLKIGYSQINIERFLALISAKVAGKVKATA